MIDHNIKSLCDQMGDGDIELDHISIDNLMANTLQYIADGGEVKKESLQLLVDTFHKLTKWYA
jgi:hypothetical protein